MADQVSPKQPKPSSKPSSSSSSPRSKDKEKEKHKKDKKNKMEDLKQPSSSYSSPGESRSTTPSQTSSPGSASPAFASPASHHDEPSDSIKRETFSAEKRRSKSKLSSSGSKPGLRHSMSSTLSRREQPLDTSDSVGEAAEDEGNSPDLNASKSIARTTFSGKIVNPTRLTYGEVMKAWEKLTNIAQAPKRQEQYVTGKEVAQAILWDRKHGL